MSEGLRSRRSDAAGTAAAGSNGSVARSSAAAASAAPADSWFSANPSKRHGEIFFLAWGAVWISIMATIVATRMFEDFTADSYMIVGLIIALPPIVLPVLFPGEADRRLPLLQRYTSKANVWIFILSWMANYFWTHYFYHVLGCAYTFPAWRLNDVPFALYLITHSYFHFYHVLSSMALRVAWRKLGNKSTPGALLAIGLLIALMSWIVAFMETFTIQNFPYYHIPDRFAMYVYGSCFYALYFVTSFPLFLRLDEEPGECWSMGRATLEAMGASMIITQLLDAWRLAIGPIVDLEAARESAKLATPKHLGIQPPSKENGVPFVY